MGDPYFEHDAAARIIDPEAFDGYDRAHSEKDGFMQIQLIGRLNAAREKARAIAELPPTNHVAGGEPAAWLHPTAGWAHADYHQVRLHCFNDGPMPVPLYRAAATEADHG